MKLFSAHYDFASAVVVYSVLQSGGFTPILRDYHQCAVNPLYVEAFGGVKIDLPDDQFEDAKAFLDMSPIEEIGDFDPIPDRKLSAVFKSILAFFCVFPGFVLMIRDLIFSIVKDRAPKYVEVNLMHVSLLLLVTAIAIHARYRVRRLHTPDM